jgi:hypothetical protein
MLSHKLRRFKAAAAQATDANFKQVALLLHGDGTNGAQNNTFLDSSTNNFTITRNGNTTQGTNTPFSQADGYWSNFFDGANDRLTIADNANLRPGTSNFTIEAWIYRAASGAAHTIFAKGASTPTGFAFLVTSTNVLRFTNTSSNIDSTGTISANTWTHVAAVREGTGSNQFKLYINGVNDGTGTVSTDYNQTTEARIGENRGATDDFNGYISNLRLVIGTAVYTAAFTPPTTPLTAITNTSLLTCQSNRFVDNSSNNFTVTPVNNTSVQPFSRFAPTSAYSTSVNGGSLYFDGTGDYITFTETSFTSDFTFECYVYLLSTADQILASSNGTYVGANTQIFRINETTAGNLSYYGGANSVVLSAGIRTNQWLHLAMSRTSGTLKTFVNGISIDSRTYTNTFRFGAIGGLVNPTLQVPTTSYISNFRAIDGTGIYSANFTPPTAPLTAITNTSLLLSGTNAGIFDNAINNNLETVGNAQVSTSVTKFGTGSMSFDGTGDYLTAPASRQLAFGTGNFTIECWINPTGTQSQYAGIYTARNGTTPVILSFAGAFSPSGATIDGWLSGGTPAASSTATITSGTWTHLAFVRNNGVCTVYVNGVAGSTTTTNNVNIDSSLPNIGRDSFNAALRSFNGYIDDLRVTKGIARYTANFTPPTAAFPDNS